MQAFFRIAALASLSAALIPAFAATQPTQTQRVEITAPRQAALAVLSIVDSVQHFELANGRRMEFFADGDTLQLKYRSRRSLLKHDGQGSFVTSDGRVSMRFTLDGAGRPDVASVEAPANWF